MWATNKTKMKVFKATDGRFGRFLLLYRLFYGLKRLFWDSYNRFTNFYGLKFSAVDPCVNR